MLNAPNTINSLFTGIKSLLTPQVVNQSSHLSTARYTKRGDDILEAVNIPLLERDIKQNHDAHNFANIAEKQLQELSSSEINTNIFMHKLVACIIEEQQKPTEEQFLTVIKKLTPKQIQQVKDQSGYNLLMWSILVDCPKITQWLLQQKIINFNATDVENNTAVHIAASLGNAEMLEILLSHSTSNINAQNNKQETAIILAAKNISTFGSMQLVKYLHSQGANTYLKDNTAKDIFAYLQNAQESLDNTQITLLDALNEIHEDFGRTRNLTTKQTSLLSIALKRQDVTVINEQDINTLLSIAHDISEDEENFEKIIQDLQSKNSVQSFKRYL